MARKNATRPGVSRPEMPRGVNNRSPELNAPTTLAEDDACFIPTLRSESNEPWPVVGIGASAGGLEAFTRLLRHLPPDTGMSYVLVQHLAPHHPSILATLLSRATTMPVMAVEHGTAVAPNHVYVIPPGSLMSISEGVLQLSPRSEDRGPPRIIDHFLRSLAVDRKALAIGVLLSGADADGALGMQAIRASGGIAIVQSESSAKHTEMPRAAMSAGPVDLVLAPERIASELRRLAHCFCTPPSPLNAEPATAGLFARLHAETGIDFTRDRFDVVWPRIRRRMLLRGHELDAYIPFLDESRSEVLALSDDLLFRAAEFLDPITLDTLQKKILPGLLLERSASSPVRVWVPGCSTGEEVYSIAMCLVESAGTLGIPSPIQVFGTDLSDRAIGVARLGRYTEYALAGIPPERLQNFFRRVADGYQVVKSLRELCVFARQNLVSDPPFGRLDLISCRDLLRYLRPEWQRDAFIRLHYGLRPNGCLMLRDPESLAGHSGLFKPIPSAPSFFSRLSAQTPLTMIRSRAGLDRGQRETAVIAASTRAVGTLDADLENAIESTTLAEPAPAWVLLNEDLEIVHSSGDVSPYLTLPPGGLHVKLLDAASVAVRSELQTLLVTAKDQAASLESARSEAETPQGHVRLHVRRTSGDATHGPGYVVLFVHTEAPGAGSAAIRPTSIPALAEAERFRERYDAISHSRDAANRELKAARDKIQSGNDNLRAINEELEVTKEELQAANEELVTVNDELQDRNAELTRLSEDLGNLLTSTTIPLVMVDMDLRVRRVTTAAQHVFNLQPTDLGRPFGQIRTRLAVHDLESRLRSLVKSLEPQQLEVQDDNGCSYYLRMYPCHASDGRVQGAVLVLVDVDQVRRAEIAATAARQFAESVVKNLKVPLLVLRSDLRVHSANEAFCNLCGIKGSDIAKQPLYEWNESEWDLPPLRAGLRRLVNDGSPLENLELQHAFQAGVKTLLVNAHSVRRDGELQILLAMEDITARKHAEHVMAEDREQLRRSVHETEAALLHNRAELQNLTARLLNAEEDERRRVSRELHDDLSQKVAKLQFDVETLQGHFSQDQGDLKRRALDIRDEVAVLAEGLRGIAHRLHPSMLENLGLPAALKCLAREFADAARLQIRFSARTVPKRIPPEISISLYRIAQEALRNISKHAGNAAATMRLTGAPHRLRLSIRDTGAGFDPQSARGRTGLGLISIQERVRLLHGTFSLYTRPEHGVHIVIEVPLDTEGSAHATAAAAR